MKKLLTAMFVALLMVGCGEDTKKPAGDSPESNASLVETPPAKTAEVGGIDLDDNETRNRIIAEAIDSGKLQMKGEEGDQLFYAPNQQTPYTGWGKLMWGNEQVKLLAQFEDGKGDGLWTFWHENGQKSSEINYKDSKPDGHSTIWHENGQKLMEANFQDSTPIGLQTVWYANGQKHSEISHKLQGRRIILWNAFVWKPNGDKCPLTNLVNGNGVVVEYKEDGTEKRRVTYNDGEMVRASSRTKGELPLDIEPSGDVKFYELKDLITNLGGPVKARYIDIQLKMEGLAGDFERILEQNEHRIRDKALTILGNYTYEDAQLDGFQERVRVDLKKGFSTTLRKYRDGESDLIRQISFTQFVIQ